MRGKISKALLAIILSIGLLGQGHASSILYFNPGAYYTDADGNIWEFLGSFDVADGPQFIDQNNDGIQDSGDNFPVPLNGLEAAVQLGFGDITELAISAFEFDVANGAVTADEVESIESLFGQDIVEVNFMSWYDGFETAVAISAQDIVADVDGDDQYKPGTDRSAFVQDRSAVGDYTNYVFKAVQISAPSGLLIMALTLIGLGLRQRK